MQAGERFCRSSLWGCQILLWFHSASVTPDPSGSSQPNQNRWGNLTSRWEASITSHLSPCVFNEVMDGCLLLKCFMLSSMSDLQFIFKPVLHCFLQECFWHFRLAVFFPYGTISGINKNLQFLSIWKMIPWLIKTGGNPAASTPWLKYSRPAQYHYCSRG